MSVPHSVVHARNYQDVEEEEQQQEPPPQRRQEPPPQQRSGGLGGHFQKMRRRLTVTGASENIDGGAQGGPKGPPKGPPQYGKHPGRGRGPPPGREHRGPGGRYGHGHGGPPPQNKYQAAVRCAVTEYSGVSKKGHAPYNPRKKNQDALIMADDPSTNTLVLCVLDGHGEYGDAVSQTFREQLVYEMFEHPAWATHLKQAVADAIHRVERDLLRNYRIDAEFSGTTLSMAIIRGNHLTGVNIGDSRVIMGKEENGRLVAQDITFDHKPDTPGF